MYVCCIGVANYAGGGCVGVERFLSLACSERNMMVHGVAVLLSPWLLAT